MAITNSFINAVREGDIRGIRIMMKDSLLVDPTFTEFSEMEKMARNVEELYDQHDGRQFEKDKAVWNDDYMSELRVQIVNNFSEERIEHLKAVVRYLRPVDIHPRTSLSGDKGYSGGKSYDRYSQAHRTSYQGQSWQNEHDNSLMNKRSTKIAAGAGVGGVFGGALAAVTGGSLLIGVLGGVVLGGTVAVVATNGGQ